MLPSRALTIFLSMQKTEGERANRSFACILCTEKWIVALPVLTSDYVLPTVTVIL